MYSFVSHSTLSFQLGDLYADEKNMMDKFFAFAPTANFLDAFVDGDGVIPLISGSIRIRGLLRARHGGLWISRNGSEAWH